MINLPEELENRMQESETENITKILFNQKHILRTCNRVLDCEHCSALSDHMMLLAIACRGVVLSLDQITRDCTRRESRQTRGLEDSHRRRNYWTLSIDDYQVDSEEGWTTIIKVLIVIRLREIQATLERLKGNAAAHSRRTQISVLSGIEQKITNMMTTI